MSRTVVARISSLMRKVWVLIQVSFEGMRVDLSCIYPDLYLVVLNAISVLFLQILRSHSTSQPPPLKGTAAHPKGAWQY